MVALVEQLLRQGTLGALCAALRPQDGAALLVAMGISVTGSAPHEQPPELPALFHAAVAHWSRDWGRDDARAHWLTSVALVADRPERLLSARLGAMSPLVVASALAAHPRGLEPNDRERSPRPANWRQREAPSPARAARRPLFAAFDFPTDELPEPRSQPAPPTELVSHNVDAIERVPFDRVTLEPRTFDRRPGASDPSADEVVAERVLEGQRRPSKLGGLYFLLAVLERLGLGKWLAATPAAVEWQLPTRILREAAVLARGEGSDPALAPLGVARGDAPDAFVAPASWWTGFAREADLRLRAHGGDDAFVIDDGPGGLPLVAWTGARDQWPSSARALIAQRRVALGPRYKTGATHTVLRAWLIACRRWLLHYAALSLRDVVRRSANVVVTRTHVDVLMHHAQADLRIRRAGLDLNPGWVPWLGRVVAFHYVDGAELLPYRDRGADVR